MLLLVAAMPIISGAWAQSIRVPAGPAAGTSFAGTAAAPPTTNNAIRVALFNIHGGTGSDNVRDLGRTAECLRGFDLVGLNEVHGPKLWQRTDQCELLAEALGTQWLFAPTEWRFWHGSFGNGLLTDLPVVSWQRMPLARAGAKTHRNMVLAIVEVDRRRVNVLLTHLDSRDATRRQEQLRVAGELFLSLAEPAVLMGDLNTQPGDEQLERLLAAPGVEDCIAHTAEPAPQSRLDWILVRGLRCARAGMIDRGASDHPCYWAELEVAP